MSVEEIKQYYPKKIDYIHKKIWLWSAPFGSWISSGISEKIFDKYFANEKSVEKY